MYYQYICLLENLMSTAAVRRKETNSKNVKTTMTILSSQKAFIKCYNSSYLIHNLSLWFSIMIFWFNFSHF